MIEAICRRLHDIDVPEPRSRPSSGVVLGMDRDPMAKVTLLLFDDQGEIAAVAKVARDSRAEPALRNEGAALCRLAGEALPSLRPQLPVPLLLERVRGRLVLVSSAVTGAPLTVRYYTPGHVADAHSVAVDFALAGSWIAALQRETATPTATLGEAYERYVVPVVEHYRRRIGGSGWEAQVFAALENDTRKQADLDVPTPLLHGDYAIGNILMRGGTIAGVVDWELSRPAALPLLDILKFAASYSSFLDRAQPPHTDGMRGHPGWRTASQRWPAPAGWTNLTGFMHGFFGDGWYPELVRQFIHEHATRLGLPPSILPLLLRVFIMEQATVLANPVYASGYRALLHTVHDTITGRALGPVGAQ